jgi:hypothetical protein
MRDRLSKKRSKRPAASAHTRFGGVGATQFGLIRRVRALIILRGRILARTPSPPLSTLHKQNIMTTAAAASLPQTGIGCRAAHHHTSTLKTTPLPVDLGGRGLSGARALPAYLCARTAPRPISPPEKAPHCFFPASSLSRATRRATPRILAACPDWAQYVCVSLCVVCAARLGSERKKFTHHHAPLCRRAGILALACI